MTTLPRNNIKQFILKLILITVLILVFDFGIGTLLTKYYFSQGSGGYHRTTYSINNTSEDILVFGSSRANHSYVPEIFEDSLSLTFYNTGKDGNDILYNYAIFKAITQRYSPQIIILDIRPENLAFNAAEYDRLSVLLPYYDDYPEIADIVNLRSRFENIKLISSIYPFNSMILRIAMGNLGFNKKREQDNKGYVPIFRTMEYEEIDILQNKASMTDKNKVEALKDIASTCQQKDIDLIFVYSPIWYKIPKSPYDNLISEICTQNKVKWLNLSNDSTFMRNAKYFSDKSHLNDNGARVFSSVVANEIKNLQR
jgi:hypothetical protein